MTTTEDSLAQAIDQPEAYFIPLGTVTEGELSYERFMPTSFTYGAWGPFQHGAPPSALLTRMLERRRLESEGMRILASPWICCRLYRTRSSARAHGSRARGGKSPRSKPNCLPTSRVPGGQLPRRPHG